MIAFTVIGINDNQQPYFTPEVLQIINNGRVFSGGKRHHDIVAPLLPPGAVWIDITTPIDAVFANYKAQACHCSNSPQEKAQLSQSIIVFASGDPLFFGFANTIRRVMPEAKVTLFPTFNSLQMLAHRLVMPYHDMRIVSLTGRPWHEFDRALIERASKIGILTDHEHTPAAIARRMMDYGFIYYNMYVGEHLGNNALERVKALTLKEASESTFTQPNCVILTVTSPNRATATAGTPATTTAEACRERVYGIPDGNFALLDGREKMITKMPIRLLTLQVLDLPQRHTLWDIGACTGSVSIEARLLFPHLRITAFELRPECEAIIQENCRRHGAPGIDVVIGNFCHVDCANSTVYGRPDAVFVGGHGGELKEIMSKVSAVLAPGGVIVMNSVTSPIVARMTERPGSHQLWDDACHALGLQQEPPLRIQLNDYNPIEILKAKKTR